jgi:hypothetical protein
MLLPSPVVTSAKVPQHQNSHAGWVAFQTNLAPVSQHPLSRSTAQVKETQQLVVQ